MNGLGRLCNTVDGVKPTMMMIVLQVSMAGVNVCYKLASHDGMPMRIMVAYRFLFAAATVVPLALYVERNNRPKLTRIVIFQAFFCALFGGSMAQNLYGQSLVMTSATFASATINLITPLTFIMAVFFRLERFELRSMAGKAKVMGTLVSIGGAMLLTFFKGTRIKMWSSDRFSLLKDNNNHSVHGAASHPSSINHILGPFLAICSNVSAAISLIFQAKMSQTYSYHYSSTALISVMGFLQAVVIALCVERQWSVWKLGWNVRLLAVVYSGVVASGLMIIVTMWCVRMRGPLFVSAFSPLVLILVALAGSLFLNETLHLGSVLGAVVMIVGLYLVLWGKSKEMRRITQLVPSKSNGNFQDQHIDGAASGEAEKSSINIIGIAPNLPLNSDIDALDDEQNVEEGVSSSSAKA